MNHPSDHTAHQFDIWLDAFVAGMSTPASRAAADSVPGDIRDTARQFHTLAGLAHGAERSPTGRPLVPTWEDFMSTNAASLSPNAHPDPRRAAELVSARSIAARPVPHRTPGTTHHHPAWDRAFSTALVAVLILSTIGMVWRAAGNPFTNLGDGSPPEPLQFAALQDDGRSELFEVAPVPDHSECTIDPLTVDEVLLRVQTPRGYAAPNATPGAGTPTTFEREQEQLEGVALRNVPDLATVDAIEANQRQWLACHLAGDLFRVWALQSGTMTQATIFGTYGPQFDLDRLRTDLESLAAGEDDTPFQSMSTSPDAYVPLVVTSGWDTFYPEPHMGKIEIPLYWTTMDGSVAAIPSYLSESQYNDPAYETLRNSTNLPNQATYILDFETKQWILDGFQSGGRG